MICSKHGYAITKPTSYLHAKNEMICVDLLMSLSEYIFLIAIHIGVTIKYFSYDQRIRRYTDIRVHTHTHIYKTKFLVVKFKISNVLDIIFIFRIQSNIAEHPALASVPRLYKKKWSLVSDIALLHATKIRVAMWQHIFNNIHNNQKYP